MQAFHEHIGRGVRYFGGMVCPILRNIAVRFIPCTTTEIQRWWGSGWEQRLRCVKWYGIFGAGVYGLLAVYKLTWKMPKTLGFFIFVLSVYTVIAVATSLLTVFPRQSLEPLSTSVNKETAVIIAAHMSETDIYQVLERILLHFPPENVYVADNAGFSNPPDNTQEICRDHGVNYVYYRIPCKTSALLNTADSLPEKFEYIMCLDDDTLLPETPFEIDSELFRDSTVGVSYLLRVRDCGSLLSEIIQYEFLQLSWRNYFKSRWSTMKFLPGIIAVWKRKEFFEIYRENPCRYSSDGKYLPFGEDGWAGYIARKKGYTLKIDLRYAVYTRVPEKICCCGVWGQGYGSSTVWKQRGYRWYRNYLRRLPKETWLLFTYLPKGANRWRKKAVYTVDWVYGLFLVLSSLSIPIVFMQVILAKLPLWVYVAIHGGMYGTGLVNGLWVRWFTLRNRPDLKPSYTALVVYPIFYRVDRLCEAMGWIG